MSVRPEADPPKSSLQPKLWLVVGDDVRRDGDLRAGRGSGGCPALRVSRGELQPPLRLAVQSAPVCGVLHWTTLSLSGGEMSRRATREEKP
jgi:hypothetical protein